MEKAHRLIPTVLVILARAIALAILLTYPADTTLPPPDPVTPWGAPSLYVTLRDRADPNDDPAAYRIESTVRLPNAMSTSTTGLIQRHHPNGAVSVHLQGRFQSGSFARIDETGKLVVGTDRGAFIEEVLRDQPARDEGAK